MYNTADEWRGNAETGEPVKILENTKQAIECESMSGRLVKLLHRELKERANNLQ